VSSREDRIAAVSAQLDALPEHELRVFVAYLAGLNVDALELPLADFLAPRAAWDAAAGYGAVQPAEAGQ
jgi:hypothetical protein